MAEPKGPKMAQMAHTRCMLDKQGHTRARTCTLTRVGQPQRTHASTRARPRVQMCNTCRFSTTTTIRERSSVLPCMYVACRVVLDVGGEHAAFVFKAEGKESYYTQTQYSSQSTSHKPRAPCGKYLLLKPSLELL